MPEYLRGDLRTTPVAEKRERLRFGQADEIRHHARDVLPIGLRSDDCKTRARCRKWIASECESRRGDRHRKYHMRGRLMPLESEVLLGIGNVYGSRRGSPRNAHVRERPYNRTRAIGKGGLIDDREVADVDACRRTVSSKRAARLGDAHGPEQTRRRNRRMEIVHARTTARIGRDLRSLKEGDSKMEERARAFRAVRRDITAAHQTDIGRRPTEAEALAAAVGSDAGEIVAASEVSLKMKEM